VRDESGTHGWFSGAHDELIAMRLAKVLTFFGFEEAPGGRITPGLFHTAIAISYSLHPYSLHHLRIFASSGMELQDEQLRRDHSRSRGTFTSLKDTSNISS
jgi:hypothetical protein